MVTETYWESVERVTKDWPNDGPIPREEVLSLWRWDNMKVNLLEGLGLTWRGESFKDQGWSVLMVLKVAKGMTPLVIFITERTTTGCMRVLLRQIDQGALELREDKFG